MLERMQPAAQARVTDIGCGTGQLWGEVAGPIRRRGCANCGASPGPGAGCWRRSTVSATCANWRS
ncbi:hypothetical protein NZ30_14140 [Xanthomonas translucens pv. undulosa]|nr:hypothetical protein NZ30_14140 [Xanthomonas translucens pv. undulosa]